MSPPKVDYRRRAWPRVLVFVLVGVAAAGCSNSARFDSSSYSSSDRPIPTQNLTSVQAPLGSARVDTQPLPAVSPPATVAAAPGTFGAASSANYRSSGKYSDITGSS